MNKIKTRIFEYTPQPIQRFWMTLGLLALVSVLLFAGISLMTLQGWLFGPFEKSWPLLILLSLLLTLTFFRDKIHIFKFPFFIQRHLIDPELALDLKEFALRSSDAIILDFKQMKPAWWQAKHYELLLERHPHETPQWFRVNFNQVFNQHLFFNVNVIPSEKLIGQQILIYYLARSHQIVQIFQLSPENDLSTAKAYVDAAQLSHSHFDKIPTRIILDLPKITRIEAVRSADYAGHALKLTTSYGKYYHIHAYTPQFDKLELALSPLIDFISYKQFKQNPALQHMQLSKQHPQLLRYVVILIILALVLSASGLLLEKWEMLVFAVFLLYWYISQIQNFYSSPWLEEDEFK